MSSTTSHAKKGVVNPSNVAGRFSRTADVEDKFIRHVMCNYTPRAPGELQMKLWRLGEAAATNTAAAASAGPRQAADHEPVQGPPHPSFAGHPFNSWCKLLTDFDAPAGRGRKYAMKFSFEYGCIHQRKLDKTKDLTRAKCARSQPL